MHTHSEKPSAGVSHYFTTKKYNKLFFMTEMLSIIYKFLVQSLVVNQMPILCIILGCNFYRKAEPASKPLGTLNAY